MTFGKYSSGSVPHDPYGEERNVAWNRHIYQSSPDIHFHRYRVSQKRGAKNIA